MSLEGPYELYIDGVQCQRAVAAGQVVVSDNIGIVLDW